MKTSTGIRVLSNESGAVLLDTNRGGTFSVNQIGARILVLLDEGCSFENIVDRVSQDFNAPKSIVEGDVREFITSLTNQGLLGGDVSKDISLAKRNKS